MTMESAASVFAIEAADFVCGPHPRATAGRRLVAPPGRPRVYAS
jgi:hypothetical protein